MSSDGGSSGDDYQTIHNFNQDVYDFTINNNMPAFNLTGTKYDFMGF